MSDSPADGAQEDAGEGARRGDLEWGTIPHLARSAAERFGDAPAVVDGETQLTFTQLWEHARGAAKAFVSLGVEPGDRVAVWSPNIWEWPVALLGIQAVGGVVVPLNTRYRGTEAAHILRASRARVLVTIDQFLDIDYLAMLDGQDLPDLERTVVLRDRSAASALVWSDLPAAAREVDDAVVEARLGALGPDDLADMLFTSGTTGLPKGVLCTHGQNLRGSTDWADLVGLREGDRYLVVNPYFHSFGYRAGIVASLVAGATMVPQAVFDVTTAMRNVAEHGITVFPGPPAIYQTVLSHPALDSFDLSSLRLAVTGAASIPVSLVQRMRDELGFDTVITAYGLSEATGFVTCCRRGDDAETIATTSGRAFPGVEVRVVAADREPGDGVAGGGGPPELPRGEAGEVLVRGYNVMRGYFEAPEQTASTVGPDGWLHTGDVGVMDERGYLRITDRKKDMFVVGGFNAYPAEIENLMLAHEGVAQVAVVGVPDRRMGEVGMAYVVPTPGHDVDADDVVEWARQEMANYKAPRHVRVVDSLPLNAAGKVIKYQLRERAVEDLGEAGTSGRVRGTTGTGTGAT